MDVDYYKQNNDLKPVITNGPGCRKFGLHICAIVVIYSTLTFYFVNQADGAQTLSPYLGPVEVTEASLSQRVSVTRRKDQIDELSEERSIDSEQQRTRQGKLTGNKKNIDIPTTDCLAKRNEILNRQANSNPNQPTQQPKSPSSTTTNVSFQRLKPNLEPSAHMISRPANGEPRLPGPFDSEHVPKCNHRGGYEPIQCHKIGYCWCVNKYGQAIKNTAFKLGEKPDCDMSMYESDSNESVVVAGVSSQAKDYLSNASQFESTTPNGHLNFEATEPSTDHFDLNSGDTNPPSASSLSAQKYRGPLMALVPNGCSGSRKNAQERAEKSTSDSIWIPDCDANNNNLYAQRQCHRSRVCWCVDQITGLPLRSNDLLTPRSMETNCTELKHLLELSQHPKPKDIFYLKSSEHCDSDRRLEFVITLNGQIRHQLNEYIRQNPSSMASLPQDIRSADPLSFSEAQVSRWKFHIMDQDKDGKLSDREWSRFKNNFKLVERADELEQRFKQQRGQFHSLAPLQLLRSQRKCWRDFLIFCERGDDNVTINLNEWLGCTDVPPKSQQGDYLARRRVGSIVYRENLYVHSQEAAMNRTKHKNPFTGLLKPD